MSWTNLYSSEQHQNSISKSHSTGNGISESHWSNSSWPSQTIRKLQKPTRSPFVVKSTRSRDNLYNRQDHGSHEWFQINSSRMIPFHDFQIPQNSVRNNHYVENVVSNSISMRIGDKQKSNLSEISENSLNKTNGSFLFVTIDNEELLKFVFRNHQLEVLYVRKTEIQGILVVLFKTHEAARRAFITQRDIGIRMVPHICSKKSWFQNPSPRFHVVFETRRRLTVKSGKSLLKSNIGFFLMIDASRERGCRIWADQLKGHRLRVVGYVGMFMWSDGRIEERHIPPPMHERKVIGWISTICSKSKEIFAVRLSGNKIQDYLYDSKKHALE